MLAELLAQRTRENDLDKEEKLAKSEKYANDTIQILKEAPSPIHSSPTSSGKTPRRTSRPKPTTPWAWPR